MKLRHFQQTFLENRLCKNIKATLNNLQEKGEEEITNLPDDIQRLNTLESAGQTIPSLDRKSLNLEDQSLSLRKRDLKT